MTREAARVGRISRPEEGTTMKPWLLGGVGLWMVAGWAWYAVAGELPMPPVEPRIMPPALSWPSILTSIVYGLIGLILLLIGYYIYEIITPWSVKEELIAHRNPAVGMVVAAFILGMAIVIAAAII
jgi:putative membrane protein